MHRSKLPLTSWFWAAHLMTTHSNGMSARQLADQLSVTYKTTWLLTQKLRRTMVDPNRDPLEGVVEVDQAEIPFREGDAFFEPGNAAKILVIGAVEVIDRDTNQAKPRRKHAKLTERPTVVVAHSLGSVVAYNILRSDARNLNIPLLVTVWAAPGHPRHPKPTGPTQVPRTTHAR